MDKPLFPEYLKKVMKDLESKVSDPELATNTPEDSPTPEESEKMYRDMDKLFHDKTANDIYEDHEYQRACNLLHDADYSRKPSQKRNWLIQTGYDPKFVEKLSIDGLFRQFKLEVSRLKQIREDYR